MRRLLLHLFVGLGVSVGCIDEMGPAYVGQGDPEGDPDLGSNDPSGVVEVPAEAEPVQPEPVLPDPCLLYTSPSPRD